MDSGDTTRTPSENGGGHKKYLRKSAVTAYVISKDPDQPANYTI